MAYEFDDPCQNGLDCSIGTDASRDFDCYIRMELGEAIGQQAGNSQINARTRCGQLHDMQGLLCLSPNQTGKGE